jgi:hypothetical protein
MPSDPRTLQQSDWLFVDHNARRIPAHRLKVVLSKGIHCYAYVLRSVGLNGSARDTLVIINAARYLNAFPRHVQKLYTSFMRELRGLKDEWKMKAVPTMKRVTRTHGEDPDVLSGFELRTVAYRHGAVPVLVVGKIDDLAVALMPEDFAHGTSRDEYTDDEYVEI